MKSSIGQFVISDSFQINKLIVRFDFWFSFHYDEIQFQKLKRNIGRDDCDLSGDLDFIILFKGWL